MKDFVVFLMIVLAGGTLISGPLLAGPFAARGRLAPAVMLLLPMLAGIGAGTGFVGGAFLSIALFGFDLNGRAPWWDRHLPTGGAACGALAGVVASVLVVQRWHRAATGTPPNQAEDYDDRGPGPSQ